MKPADYAFLADLLKRRSGLVLSRDRAYLLESRLLPVARKRGLEDLGALVGALRRGADERLAVDVVEAMTTNESFFFRDIRPFEIFRDETLPRLLAARTSRRRLRIWSAAASTGQEPYSLAMILDDMAAELAGWQVEIIGTDLSAAVLAKARAGRYSQFEVQRGLPIGRLMAHFSKAGEAWQIDPAIRARVAFRTVNLLDDFAGLGRFDVIFCRNVLIYFDQMTKADVLTRLSRQLAPDGALFLGGAETVIGICDHFRPVPGLGGVYARAA